MGLYQIAVSILVIGLLVFFHELGHFLVAKWCGVGVLKFSVGFGPAIISFRRKETIYQISIIPLGGFVRMVGDIADVVTGDTTDTHGNDPSKAEDISGEAKAVGKKPLPAPEVTDPEIKRVMENKDYWFIHRPLREQAAIVVAGPVANLLLSVFILWLTIAIYGEAAPSTEPVIGGVSKTNPAALAGLKVGDRVKAMDGVPTRAWEDIFKTVRASNGKTIVFDLEREDGEVQISVTPKEEQAQGQKTFIVGIMPKTDMKGVGVGDAFISSLKGNYNWISMTFQGLWGMIRGQVSHKDLAGPIFIFSQAGEQAKKGLDSLLIFMAFLSVSLGVLNLLPIPVLDGGHLLFFLLEALFGPMSMRKKEIAQQIGATFLIGLMVLAISNDITREPIVDKEMEKWDVETPKPKSDPKKSVSPETSGSSGSGIIIDIERGVK